MAGLEGTVQLPVFGTVRKKTAALAGGGAVVFVLGVWWYRQRKASQAAAATGASGATSGGAVTDPAGNSCAALNPATGFCPGTPADQQAQAGLGTGAFDTSGLGGGLSGFYYGGGSGGTGPAVQSTAPGPGNFADNAEWAQYAENYMITTLGADPAATGNALGKYITGQPVDTAGQNIIQEAIAIAGYPPVAGQGGDPPGIKTVTGPPPPPPPPPAQKITVPYLIGERVENADSALQALGLKSSFGARKPGTPYTVKASSPAAGAKVARGSTVHLTIAPATSPRPVPPREISGGRLVRA